MQGNSASFPNSFSNINLMRNVSKGFFFNPNGRRVQFPAPPFPSSPAPLVTRHYCGSPLKMDNRSFFIAWLP